MLKTIVVLTFLFGHSVRGTFVTAKVPKTIGGVDAPEPHFLLHALFSGRGKMDAESTV